MPGPISGMRFIHAAICREAETIERVAADEAGLGEAQERITFLAHTVKLHTDGEEASIYRNPSTSGVMREGPGADGAWEESGPEVTRCRARPSETLRHCARC